jgi:hypothetical protein
VSISVAEYLLPRDVALRLVSDATTIAD